MREPKASRVVSYFYIPLEADHEKPRRILSRTLLFKLPQGKNDGSILESI